MLTSTIRAFRQYYPRDYQAYIAALAETENRQGVEAADRAALERLRSFIAEQQVTAGRDLWPRDGITLHSANWSAVPDMERTIERYAGQVHEVKRTLTPGGKPRFTFT